MVTFVVATTDSELRPSQSEGYVQPPDSWPVDIVELISAPISTKPTGDGGPSLGLGTKGAMFTGAQASGELVKGSQVLPIWTASHELFVCDIGLVATEGVVLRFMSGAVLAS